MSPCSESLVARLFVLEIVLRPLAGRSFAMPLVATVRGVLDVRFLPRSKPFWLRPVAFSFSLLCGLRRSPFRGLDHLTFFPGAKAVPTGPAECSTTDEGKTRGSHGVSTKGPLVHTRCGEREITWFNRAISW
jgi:hypothetical protein